MKCHADHLNSRVERGARAYNVVATFSLGRALDQVPLAIALGGRAATSNFPAVVSRSTDTATANSIFSTGRTVMVGCKSEMHALLGAQMIAHEIYTELGILTTVTNFKVRNVVCRVEVGYSIPPAEHPADPMPAEGGINMRMLLSDIMVHPATAEVNGFNYAPEKFPGLKWTRSLPDFPNEFVTFAWFQRGRGVATGLVAESRVEQINKIINSMPCYERGNEYRVMTQEELLVAREDDRVASRKPMSKKRKREEHARAQKQEAIDAAAAAAGAT